MTANMNSPPAWTCGACTFRNGSGMALACTMCASERRPSAGVVAQLAASEPPADSRWAAEPREGPSPSPPRVPAAAAAPMIPCEVCGALVSATVFSDHVVVHMAAEMGSPVAAAVVAPLPNGGRCGGRTCDAGHALVLSSSAAAGYAAGWECDVCHRPREAGARRLHCAACRFDACEPHCGAGAAAGSGGGGGGALHTREARAPGRGFVALIVRALDARRAPGREFALCAAPVDHYSQSGGVEDGAGWACGYRNMQMICSALMAQPRWAERLFGGARSMPDLASLQRWMERAWLAGFDCLGAAHFGGRIHGSTAWLGASDCCALLRFFGVPARLVDFGATTAGGGGSGGRRRGACFTCGDEGHWANACPLGAGGVHGTGGDRKRQRIAAGAADGLTRGGGGGGIGGDVGVHVSAVGIGGTPSGGDPAAVESTHAALLAWAWAYFNDRRGTGALPALLQHDGHSRTLVGVDRVAPPGAGAQFAARGQLTLDELRGVPRPDPPRDTRLLVLDPMSPSGALADALGRQAAWERFVVRGLRTLVKPQYQVRVRVALLSPRQANKRTNTCKCASANARCRAGDVHPRGRGAADGRRVRGGEGARKQLMGDRKQTSKRSGEHHHSAVDSVFLCLSSAHAFT